MPPAICPNCGAEVPRRARACPACGADENAGWQEGADQATAADLGLPGEDFDYDEFVQREFAKPTPKPRGLHWVWWLTGVALLVAIVLFWIL